jgi:hypothetical protein
LRTQVRVARLHLRVLGALPGQGALIAKGPCP